MFLYSIDKKPFFTRPDGAVVRDLTQTMFDEKANNYINVTAYRIPVGFEMRADLIAQSVYNNSINAEFILKYNGISNPFSISSGDIILIPNLDSAKQNIKNQGESAEESTNNRIRNSYKYIDPTKVPKRDANLDKFAGRNLNKKKDEIQDGALPPNIAATGEKGITHRNGRVYFGEGIGESACLKNGMSSSEFLTKVIKSKMV